MSASLSQEYLKKCLAYDPLSGIFTWRVNKAKCSPKGSVAGSINAYGYRRIMIDGISYGAHRLVFLYMDNNLLGADKEVDHINHKRGDNSFNNLRVVTKKENQRNRSLNVNNTSGVVGITWNKGKKKWDVTTSLKEGRKFLGNFLNLDEAISVMAHFRLNNDCGLHANHGTK